MVRGAIFGEMEFSPNLLFFLDFWIVGDCVTVCVAGGVLALWILILSCACGVCGLCILFILCIIIIIIIFCLSCGICLSCVVCIFFLKIYTNSNTFLFVVLLI
jgi:hypothetical protein